LFDGNALGWWLLINGGGARYHCQEEHELADVCKNSTGEAKKFGSCGGKSDDFVRVWQGLLG